MSDATLELTKQLINQQSVTPDDADCQQIMANRLANLGFNIEQMVFEDSNGKVVNLWARKGDASPCFVFAGHTDVVPTGDAENWQSPPFTATERDNNLYGRGAADMKASLAAFVTSIEQFLQQYPNHQGSIALLITSDEEGPATCGTVRVIETLESRNEKIDYCIVGEPSSTSQLGDVIKNGRRGSLGCTLEIIGTQGHIAYPHLADNPIHHCGKVIERLTSIEWDKGNDYFPPSSLQISNIQSGTGATNVIPGNAIITFNIRFSTEQTDSGIRERVVHELNDLGVEYQCNWQLSGHPFITEPGTLTAATRASIKAVLGIDTELSTSGGTSDGRFIAPTGAQLVELGPINASIHQIDEHVALSAPAQLSKVYQEILTQLLT